MALGIKGSFAGSFEDSVSVRFTSLRSGFGAQAQKIGTGRWEKKGRCRLALFRKIIDPQLDAPEPQNGTDQDPDGILTPNAAEPL